MRGERNLVNARALGTVRIAPNDSSKKLFRDLVDTLTVERRDT